MAHTGAFGVWPRLFGLIWMQGRARLSKNAFGGTRTRAPSKSNWRAYAQASQGKSRQYGFGRSYAAQEALVGAYLPVFYLWQG